MSNEISVTLYKPDDKYKGLPTGPREYFKDAASALKFIEDHETLGYRFGQATEFIDLDRADIERRAGVVPTKKNWWKI